MLKFIRKVTEEIIIQCCRNALKKGYINIVLSENPMDMRASAANVFGQLRGRNTFLPHYLFDMLPNVHKKRGIDYLPTIGFPRPSTNKSIHANTGDS